MIDMKHFSHLRVLLIAGLIMVTSLMTSQVVLAAAPPASTTTQLTITSGGQTVSSGGSIASGSVVTLTATVMAGATAVTPGQVNFCDASAILCTDIHLLGTAALNSSGVATFKFVPGPGTHSYKTAFVGNIYGLSSFSAVQTLTVEPVTPTYWDTTAITESGSPGNYSLTATVTGFGGSEPLSGNVSFLDTSYGNTVLATAPLGPVIAEPGWLISQLTIANSSMMAEVTGDFNGDGIPDLALLCSGSVTIFFGNGDGTFTQGPTTQVAVAGEYTSVYMIDGDFNGDGKTDLAVLSYSIGSDTSSVTTFLGNGDGTFAAPKTSTVTDQGMTGMVAADFNGDGKLDLAVVGNYYNYVGVIILLGNGDGTFTATGTNLEPNENFGLIATGDFNGDGIPDLVVTNNYEYGSIPVVFLGKGDGTFTSMEISFTLDNLPNSVVVGDFNSDGVLDLAFSDVNDVEIALGNGDGTFEKTPSSPIAVPSELYSLKAGDFNHDGKLDIAGVDNDHHQIVLLVGNGYGIFTVTPTTPAVSQDVGGSFTIVAADFNGDGVPDLALLTPNSAASILQTEPSQTATATVNSIAPVGTATHNVEASYAGNSYFAPEISSNTVALSPGVAMPVITPATGVYNTTQIITITDSTPGATIYYEAYGIVNTNGFVPYTGPITPPGSGSVYIYAYATATGYQQSQQAFVTITLNLPRAPTPVITLASGYYSGAQKVTITDSMPGATIYYTTNGTTPTTSSAQYTGPITVSATETLVASALAYGYSMSPATSAQYFIAGSSNSFIYTVAGDFASGYSGDGGPATAADLNYPRGTVHDIAGNLYIADTDNNVIRKVAAGTGVITTFAGTGIGGYSGDKGPAISAQLFSPQGIALDSLGNLYIADTGNSVVRKVSATTGVITTVAGNGTYVYSGDNGPATSAGLAFPVGVALDTAGNLYILDFSKVRKVAAGTGTITTVAGNGSSGYIGDNGPAISAMLCQPQGIAVDLAGNLYIADTYNNIVREINAQTGIITTVAGTPPSNVCELSNVTYGGDGGPATKAGLYMPYAVAVDGAGDIYIADYFNWVIRKVTAGSGIITTVAGNVSTSNALGGDGGPATNAFLYYPYSVSVDSTGNLYISDYTNRVQIVTVTGVTPSTAAAAPDFSVSAGSYVNPQTVTLTDSTPGAAIYVTMDGSIPSTLLQDYHGPINVTGTVTIQAIAVAPGYLQSAPVSAAYTITTPPTAVISTVAGNGTEGFPGKGMGGPATSAEIGSPQAAALDASGNLYFADTINDVVWMVSASTGIISIVAGNGTQGYSGDNGPATSAQLESISGLAVDSAGNIYISDYYDDVVRKVTASTGVITTIAGRQGLTCISTYPSCQYGDGGPAASALLAYPQGLAVDSAGNLYIADNDHYVVRMISASTGIISTFAGNGQLSYSGDGGLATSAGLRDVESLAVDSAGNLYIASQIAGRIRKVTASTGIITTVAGNGNPYGSTGDGGLATSAEIYPEGIAVDSAGNLYISNWPTTVREVSASTGMISTVAGSGYCCYGGDGGSATVAEIDGPRGIVLDATGNLYIADSGNHRVRKVTFPGPAATPLISLASGNYYGSQPVTISDSITGASIYYTTDGSTPTTGSNLYNGAMTVPVSETLQAIAVAAGYTESAVAGAIYTISPSAASPTTTALSINPSGGTLTAGASYTLTATVSPASGSVTPTGYVLFTIGSTTQTVALNSSGIATYTGTAPTAAGGLAFSAVYQGSTEFSASTISTLNETIMANYTIAIAHTWVSGSGSDTNACTFASPCATFAGALTKTIAGGMITAMDAGDFGPVTITQSVTIDGNNFGSITYTGSSDSVIVITASANVILQNLTINGLGLAGVGIEVASGGIVIVDNCKIKNFTENGINYEGAGSLTVENSKIESYQGGANGIEIHSNANENVVVRNTVIDASPISANNFGLVVDQNAGAVNISLQKVTILGAGNMAIMTFNGNTEITGSVISQSRYGVLAGYGATISVASSMITTNSTGVCSFTGSKIRLDNNDIYDNPTAIGNCGGIVKTSTTNKVSGTIAIPAADISESVTF
jgi:sugar lactone lactonase YvrE